MTALQPSLAIVTLLLCFCGTLAEESTAPVQRHWPWFQNRKTQLPSATTTTNPENLLKIFKDSQPNAAQPAPSGFPIPVPLPGLTAQAPAAKSDNKLKQAAIFANKIADRRQVANAALKGKDNQVVAGVKQAKDNFQGIVANKIADRRQVANAALKGKDNQVVAGVKQAKDNLQGIVKDPSSIKDYKVVQTVISHPITDKVVNHPFTQKITETVLPLLKRFYKRGPAKEVM